MMPGPSEAKVPMMGRVPGARPPGVSGVPGVPGVPGAVGSPGTG